MKKSIMLILLPVFMVSLSCGEKGLISKESSHSVNDTAERLEKIITGKGMKIFARIDHAAGAEKAGNSLRPTLVLIFGNPKVGSLLMQCNQSAGIDLPQKMLIWQDKGGKAWITWNDPRYVSKRHDLKKCQKVTEKVSGVLKAFAAKAAAK